MILGRSPIGTIAYMGGLLSLPEPFCWSLVQMIQYNTEFLCQPTEYVHLDHAGTSFHSWARNGLVDRFLGEWLLFLDTDHQFEPDLCARMVSMLNQAKLDVLTGLYHYKVEPHLPVLYHWDAEKQNYNIIGDWSENSELLEVSCAGAGCLLVRRGVFDRIRLELKERPFDIIPPWSEDFSFFQRVMKLGIKVHAAPKIESAHLTHAAITSSKKHIDPSRLATPKPSQVVTQRPTLDTDLREVTAQ